MRYPNIPKDKPNDVITIHTVECTEKVTHYYQVIGKNKKESIEAVENDGYYDGSPNSDNNWVNLERIDGASEYGDYSKPKISNTSHYIPCVNYDLKYERATGTTWGHPYKYVCQSIMLIPKHVLDESTLKYVPTNQIAWARSNPICRQCQRKIKQGYTLTQEEQE